MSFAETVALGALAGFTIYLGLPAGRLQLLGSRSRVALAMFAVGILAFIFVDVMSNGISIVEHQLNLVKHHNGSVSYLVWLVVLLGVGFVAGSAGLAMLEQRMRPLPARMPPIAGGAGPGIAAGENRPPIADGAGPAAIAADDNRPPIAGGAGPAIAAGENRPPIAGGAGPAAIAAGENRPLELDLDLARRKALRRGLTIAAAIGVHNFAEGLAIGVSARAGAISLATVLIIGFALHNATEGFGIVGPLGDVTPSWKWLGVAGLIGGGPTFLGSMVGYAVTSNPLELVFYSLAGGAILYVIGEVWNGMRRMGHRELGLLLLSAGFIVGVLTDLIVTYGGG